MNDFQDLLIYKLAFQQAVTVFEITKRFPKEKLYSLTSQMRRSSRSVCSNLAEAYRKRQYPAHFKSKMSDADMENAETLVWWKLAESCNYLKGEEFDKNVKNNAEIGKLIGYAISFPERFIKKS